MGLFSGTLEKIKGGLARTRQRFGESLSAVLSVGRGIDESLLRELRDRLSEDFPEIELRLDLAEFADQILAPELRASGPRAYYDGLMFRAFAGAAAEPVGGGGRYDALFRRLGADVTASGFSLSLDRLISRGPEGVAAGAVAAEGRS